MRWEPVIGLEIHIQLATNSKLFSGTSTHFGAEPNRQASPVDLGLPGVLPVLNKEVVRMAILFGIAINAQISSRSVFARKNYFYPDLPKGYQISQYEAPIIQKGAVEIELTNGMNKTIRITRAHLEEDAGKSLHGIYPGQTGIDLNRAGVPLLEVVSEPDMSTAQEAVEYMRTIHTLVRYLRISDGNMQEGSFRCDANISLRRIGESILGTRTEIKNLNSFRYIERAIAYEIERQSDILENNGTIVRETRLFDVSSGVTRTMRKKEEENDYRYFPDPDLLPVELTPEYVKSVAQQLPELPTQKLQRYRTDYGLGNHEARLLATDPDMAAYFEVVANESCQPLPAAKWIVGTLTASLNRDGLNITQCPVPPENLAILLMRISDGTLTLTMAKTVFDAMWQREGDPDFIIQSRELLQITDTNTIETLVQNVILEHPDQVAQYRSGKRKIFGFLVGRVMRLTDNQANPNQITQIMTRKLELADC